MAPVRSLSIAEFASRYHLDDTPVVEEPVRTYHAVGPSGAQIMVHFLEGGKVFQGLMLDRVQQLSRASDYVLDLFEVGGTPVVATRFIGELVSFDDWLESAAAHAAASAGPPPSGEPGGASTGGMGHGPLGGKKKPTDTQFESVGFGPVSLESDAVASPGGPAPPDAPEEEESGAGEAGGKDEPGEFTRLFQAGLAGAGEDKADVSPPLPEPEAPAEPEPGPPEAPAAPESRAEPPGAPDPEEAGSFTQLFEAPDVDATPESREPERPEPAETPPRPSEPPPEQGGGTGEFTRLFQGPVEEGPGASGAAEPEGPPTRELPEVRRPPEPPVRRPPEPDYRRPPEPDYRRSPEPDDRRSPEPGAAPPPRPDAGPPGETDTEETEQTQEKKRPPSRFTQLFEAPEPPPPTRDSRSGGPGGPSGAPPASPPAPTGPARSEPPPPSPGPAPPEPPRQGQGEFTQLFRGPEPSGPGGRPQQGDRPRGGHSAGTGEGDYFQRLRDAGRPSGGAPPPPGPQASPPSREAPSPPPFQASRGGAGEYTRMMRQPPPPPPTPEGRGDATAEEPVAAAPPGSRRKTLIALIVVAVLTIVVIGVFAVMTLTRGDATDAPTEEGTPAGEVEGGGGDASAALLRQHDHQLQRRAG